MALLTLEGAVLFGCGVDEESDSTSFESVSGEIRREIEVEEAGIEERDARDGPEESVHPIDTGMEETPKTDKEHDTGEHRAGHQSNRDLL